MTRAPKPGRVFVVVVEFPRPLIKGERAKFVIHKRHRVDFDELVQKDWEDSCGLFGINGPIGRAVITVRFPKHVRPQLVWQFEDLPDWLAPGTATKRNLLTADRFGTVTYSWHSLKVGCSYGIAWRW